MASATMIASASDLQVRSLGHLNNDEIGPNHQIKGPLDIIFCANPIVYNMLVKLHLCSNTKY